MSIVPAGTRIETARRVPAAPVTASVRVVTERPCEEADRP